MEIRKAKDQDVEVLADLTVRLKKLNEEFDPMLKVVDNAIDVARDYVKGCLESDLILVVEEDNKIVAYIKAEIRDRVFYEPKMEGVITEFYVMPEYRRKGMGDKIIEECSIHLKEMGAKIITAKFPSQNRFAANFYEKLGFRSLKSLYAKPPQEESQ